MRSFPVLACVLALVATSGRLPAQTPPRPSCERCKVLAADIAVYSDPHVNDRARVAELKAVLAEHQRTHCPCAVGGMCTCPDGACNCPGCPCAGCCSCRVAPRVSVTLRFDHRHHRRR